MSGPAQVRSTAAIEALREALARFEKRVQGALDTLDGEMHRTEDWLEHDRPAHWKRELHGAEDRLHAAKMDLERCLMMTVAGQRPTCREQQAAVNAAKERLAYCQQKRDHIKKWQRDFRHESLEYRGRIGQLRRAMEHDVPKARAVLTKILRRLEEYQIERRPNASVAPAEAASGDTVGVEQTHASAEAAVEADRLVTHEGTGQDSPESESESTPESKSSTNISSAAR